MDQSKSKQQDHEYEFLDLSDVDDNERTRLSSALLQPHDKNAPASLNDDAADADCRSDDECQFPYNIQSNPNYIANSSWPNTSPHVANHIEEVTQLHRHSDTLHRVYQDINLLPKMSPHTNNSHPMNSPTQQQSTMANHQQHPHHQAPLHSPAPPPPAQHQNHQPNSNSIPSHNIQTQVYQQSPQPLSIPPNYLPHGGQMSGGSPMYQMMQGVPNVYFSNFTANVNVHGYTQAMQPSYISANAHPFIPADQQNQIEQQQQIPIQSNHVRGNGRRGRGRSSSGGHRRDYSSRNLNSVQEISQMPPPPSHAIDSQQMIPNSPNFGGAPYFMHPFAGAIFANQVPMSHHSAAAQHAAGTPLYVGNPVMYGYGYPPGMIYPAMVPQEYTMIDDKGEEQICPENGGAVMSPPIWHIPVEYQHMDPSIPPPPEDFIQQQQQQQDEYGQQHPEEFIAPPPNEFIPPSNEFISPSNEFIPSQQHQLQNEFIPQQPSPDFIQQSSPHELEEFGHQQDGQGFIYSQQPIEHTSPILISPGYKPNFPPEFIPSAQQHHHVPPPPEFIQHENNEIGQPLNDEMLSFDVYNNNNQDSEEKVGRFEELAVNVVGPESAVYNNTMTSLIRTHPSPVSAQDLTSQSINSNAPYMQNSDSNIQTVPNTIVVNNQSQTLIGNVSQPPMVTSNDGSVGHLAKLTNDKLSIQVDQPLENRSQPNAWTTRKSTQSVGITAMPSNNQTPVQPNTTPISVDNGPSNKIVLTSNNSNFVSSSKPIVPKVDEQCLATPILNSTQETNLLVVQNFSHPVEIQTALVEGNQKFNQADFTPLGPKSKDNVGASSADKSNESGTWASLFNKNTGSSGISPLSRQFEGQRKPVAKVLPYKDTISDNAKNGPISFPTLVPQGSSVVSTLSYSAASTQNLPHPTSQNLVNAVKKNPPAKATVAPTTKPVVQSPANEYSIRLGDFFQKYKVDNNVVSLRPRGLTNRSNYCYINAILQALVACPPFYNLMKAIPLDHPSLRSKTNTPTIDAMVELVREFSSLPQGSRLQRRDKGGNKKEDVTYELICDPSFEPLAIHKLWNATRIDNEGSQEDAEEFLSYVLNKLNDEMLELKKLVEKPAPASAPAPLPEPLSNGVEANGETADDDDEWQLIGTRNKGAITRSTDFGRTPLSDIFRGELRSRLQREGSLTSTDVMQPFFTLQLNIEKAASVKEALENFVNKDQLEGVTCTKTNQKVNAWQTMTLEKLPVVLVLHLKWFDYKADGCTKILKTVEFPIDLKLDAKILSSKKYNTKQKQYRLFAVVYHDGKDASKGHYITDVYHTGYLNWIRYDDSTVKRVAEKNVLHPHAPRVPYLLYYRRSDTVQATPAASIMNSKP